MKSIIISTNLYRFIDGSIPLPSATITTPTGIQPNPNFDLLRKWDRFVISCLSATFIWFVSKYILGSNTYQQIWDYLATSFSNQFVARKSMLRNHLFNMKKKVWFNSCLSLKDLGNCWLFICYWRKISDSDLVIHALTGLTREFDNFVVLVQIRDMSLTFNELKSILI